MTYRKRTFAAFLAVIIIIGIVFLFGFNHPSRLTLDASEIFENNAPRQSKSLDGTTFLFVIAPKNFRDEELLTTKALLEKDGAKTTVVSTTSDTVVGMLGAKIVPDGLLSDVDLSKYDGVVFVGGSGTTVLWDNPVAHKIAIEANKSGKIVAAICYGPIILARAGILKNCNATVSPSVSKEIEKYGADYTGKEIAICGNIVTANGPKAVEVFAESIEKMLLQMER